MTEQADPAVSIPSGQDDLTEQADSAVSLPSGRDDLTEQADPAVSQPSGRDILTEEADPADLTEQAESIPSGRLEFFLAFVTIGVKLSFKTFENTGSVTLLEAGTRRLAGTSRERFSDGAGALQLAEPWASKLSDKSRACAERAVGRNAQLRERWSRFGETAGDLPRKLDMRCGEVAPAGGDS